jgi:hypothetical protein
VTALPSDDTPIALLRVGDLRLLLEALLANSARQDEQIDQRNSPLGPKRHASACRRRIAAGEPGASKAGRRWLLTRTALAEELARLGRESVIVAPRERTAIERLRSDLTLSCRSAS